MDATLLPSYAEGLQLFQLWTAQVIFILEGPDGAGKSTLARALCREFNLDYHHEGPPPPGADLLLHYGQRLQQARYHPHGVVFDRFALGERVYGPVLRGEDRLGEHGWTAMSRLIEAAGAIQILCLPDRSTCYENWSRHLGYELVKEDDVFHTLYHLWDEVASRVPQDAIYDYTESTYVFEDRKPVLNLDMIGSPRATYLFVGDRGSNVHSPLDLPFFGDDNCVSYLNRALVAAGFKEEEMAFINAYPLRGLEPRVIPRWHKTIALGNAAALACGAQSISYARVIHPQYARRFHYHQLEHYALQLRACR